MRERCLLALSLIVVLATGLSLAAQEDTKGAKDYPLFSRMPGYYIFDYEEMAFDSYPFLVGKGDKTAVEGRRVRVQYRIRQQTPDAQRPSAVQVMRNFENAVKSAGGSVVYQGKLDETFKVMADGRETWVQLVVSTAGSNYSLLIIEKAGMKQDVLMNAAAMAGDISATGHVAIYGIYFDTDKADVKPESDAAIGEIAKLLQQRASLKVFVVGHTDNVGDFAYNKKLSLARAEAVVKVLVGKHAIAAARLRADGVGPLLPVASNSTDAGRAKNRRVELVEQ